VQINQSINQSINIRQYLMTRTLHRLENQDIENLIIT
jgi:hypothetical protein